MSEEFENPDVSHIFGGKRKFMEIVDKLKSTPLKYSPLTVSAKETMTCSCGHECAIMNLRRMQIGGRLIQDNVCKECVEEKDKLSAVICAKCSQVVARLSPHIDKTGFRYRPFSEGGFYHVDRCPSCTPGSETGMIMEKQIWDSCNK